MKGLATDMQLKLRQGMSQSMRTVNVLTHLRQPFPKYQQNETHEQRNKGDKQLSCEQLPSMAKAVS